MANMMVYAWEDLDHNLNETKFGDHFVSSNITLEKAKEDTIKYMRRTQFPRRGKHFDSDRVLKRVWDVSEFAIKQNKFYGHSHIDDIIRKSIGHSGTQGKEFHNLRFDELVIKVNAYLTKQKQSLPEAYLSTKQAEIAEEIIDSFDKGNKIILAELCPRFGKTIWSSAVAVEMDVELIVIASYVKTVFTSFAQDLMSFKQFAEYVHVDTGEDDYQKKINEALANGKKVFAYLSLCNGSKRQERIDFLFDQQYSRMLIVDEADFGAHREKQSKPLVNAYKKDDYIIIMTGTNADRASTHWSFDYMVSVTYFELLLQKEHTAKYQHTKEKYNVQKGKV